MTATAVEAALRRDSFLGRPVQVYPVAVSTESVALAWARQDNASEGALVVADMELSARGRRGSVWRSHPGGSLAFSVILRPGLPPQGEGLLWLLASLAAAEGVEAAAGVEAKLKWPNDVLVEGSRLGLVTAVAHLAPSRIELAVLTVRVNVDVPQPGLPQDSTSLAALGVRVQRVALLAAMLERLEVRYRESVAELLSAYRRRCTTLGARVVAELMPKGEVVGTAEDVDEAGRLVVASATGRAALGVDTLKRLR